MRRPPRVFSRLFRRSPAAETRSLDAVYGFRLGRGSAVSVHTAENLSTVLSCVGAITGALSSLPINLRRNDDTGSVVTDHPVARLLRAPNRYQTWPSYLEMTLASTVLAGNGVSAIDYDSNGAPIALRPVQWQHVVVALMPSGRLAYDVTFPTLFSTAPAPVRYFDDSILHIRDRSDDGLIGRSRLSRAPDVLANAASLQEYTSNFWAEGLAPSAALKHPKTLSEPARKRLKSDMDDHTSGRKRKLLLLEEGMEFGPLSIAPEAAEVLESRRFTVAELCRLFQVPPIVVGDFEHATLQNAQQAAAWFSRFCLTPWARKIEAEIARTLLPGDGSLAVRFDMSELVAGDPEQRMQVALAAVAGGLITSNEGRVPLGYPARPDGDVLRMLPGEPTQQQQPRPGGPQLVQAA